MEENNSDKIIEKYVASGKAIRQRLLLLALFGVIIFGLFLVKRSEIRKLNMAMESRRTLEWMKNAPDSSLKRLDNLNPDDFFDSQLAAGIVSTWVMVDNWQSLADTLRQSGYANKTPIREALAAIDKKMSTIHQDQSVNFFGIQLPIDPWYYIGLLVILIVLHDLTRIILYQNEVKSLFKHTKNEDWKLGFENLEYTGEPLSTTGKFIRIVSSFLIGLILLTPVAASILSMLLPLPSGETREGYLKAVDNILLFIILTHTVIIFFSRNIFGFRWLVDFASLKDKKVNAKFFIVWSALIFGIIMYFLPWILINLEIGAWTKALFLLFILISLLLLPAGIWLNNIRPQQMFGKCVVLASILTNVSWIVVYFDPKLHHTPDSFADRTKEFGLYLTAIIIITAIYFKFFGTGRRKTDLQ